jgi:hypothetical protein
MTDSKDGDSMSLDHHEVFKPPEPKMQKDAESVDFGNLDLFARPKARVSFPLQNILLDVPVSFGLFSCVGQFSTPFALTDPLVGRYSDDDNARSFKPVQLNVLIASHIPLPIRFVSKFLIDKYFFVFLVILTM